MLSLASDKELMKQVQYDASALNLLLVSRKTHEDLQEIIFSTTHLNLALNAALPTPGGTPGRRPNQDDIKMFFRRLSSNRIVGTIFNSAHTISMPCALVDGWRHFLGHRRHGDLKGLRTMILYEDRPSYRSQDVSWLGVHPNPHRLSAKVHAIDLLRDHDMWLLQVPELHGFEVKLSIPSGEEVSSMAAVFMGRQGRELTYDIGLRGSYQRLRTATTYRIQKTA